MTDPTAPTPDEPAPVHPDQELASAHLDGEATPEERARVEAEPDLHGQVQAFAAVADAVRDVAAPPPGLLERHLDAALAELDRPDDAVDAGGAGVVTLPRRAGAPWWQRLPMGAVAAAIVVAALVGVVGLASRTGDDADDTATATFDSADGTGAGESSMTMEADARLEESGGGAAGDAIRPQFATLDDLAASFDLAATTSGVADDQADDDGATTPAGAPPGAGSDGDAGLQDVRRDPCDAVRTAGIDPATVQTVLLAEVDGAAVTAVVHDRGDGRRLVVVDDATCEVIADRAL